MKKTIIALMALGGVAMGGEIDLLSEKEFTLAPYIEGTTTPVKDEISASDISAYEYNTWNCSVHAGPLNGQSSVSADNGVFLQMGNAGTAGKSNYAAVKLKADSPVTFDAVFGAAWNCGLNITYTCKVYGYDSTGASSEIGSWSTLVTQIRLLPTLRWKTRKLT